VRAASQRSGRAAGFPLRVQRRPLLGQGMLATATGGRVLLLIDSESDAKEQARSIYHELLHLLLLGVGKTQHDEEAIEAIAVKLADAAPEVLALCGWDTPES